LRAAFIFYRVRPEYGKEKAAEVNPLQPLSLVQAGAWPDADLWANRSSASPSPDFFFMFSPTNFSRSPT
jgi:hypothetical protein